MRVYYNEIEPSAVVWLQAAMDAGYIAKGDIDTRSIEDVTPNDLMGYNRCHFFAGIGGWDIALQLAGYEQSGVLWTGSCPCQSFSTAGKGAGFDDPRHLWPAWFWLIQQCKPDTIYGEQVAAAIGKGWLDLVANDLESEGYATTAAVLPACSVGAPHKRERLWFVAHGSGGGRDTQPLLDASGTGGKNNANVEQPSKNSAVADSESERSGRTSGTSGQAPRRPTGPYGLQLGGANDEYSTLANCPSEGLEGRTRSSLQGGGAGLTSGGTLGNSEHNGQFAATLTGGEGQAIQHDPQGQDSASKSEGAGAADHVANSSEPRLEGHGGFEQGVDSQGWKEQVRHAWSSNVQFIDCPDGKQRLIEPSICLLVDGLPSKLRKAALHGLGNAIVPQVAAEFIRSTN